MKNGLNKILAILMLYSAVSLFSNAENDAMKHDTIDYIENTQFVFSYPSFSREECDTLWEGEGFYKSITCMDDGAILVFCQGHNTISVIDFQFIDKIECKDKYTTTKRGAYRNTNAIIQEYNQDTLLRYYREDTYRSGIDIYYFNVKEQDTIKYNRILDSVKKQITAIDDSLEMANVPIIVVSSITDLANAMESLNDKNIQTDSYVINSHGNEGFFKIGNTSITTNTYLDGLKKGFSNKVIFIEACNTGRGDNGKNITEKIAKQTNSTVITSMHPIFNQYKYDGSNELTTYPNINKFMNKLGYNFTNDYRMSQNGSDSEIIYDLSINFLKGFKWK